MEYLWASTWCTQVSYEFRFKVCVLNEKDKTKNTIAWTKKSFLHCIKSAKMVDHIADQFTEAAGVSMKTKAYHNKFGTRKKATKIIVSGNYYIGSSCKKWATGLCHSHKEMKTSQYSDGKKIFDYQPRWKKNNNTHRGEERTHKKGFHHF